MSVSRLARSIALVLGLVAGEAARADIIVGNAVQPGRVNVYADAAMGDAAPLRSITGLNTQLTDAAFLAYDRTGGLLYVGDFQGQAIRVFDPRVGGDVAPVRTITSPSLGQPRDLVPLAQHNELMVIAFLSFVHTYPLNANGAVGAVRRIDREGAMGSLTRLTNPSGLAHIPALDEIAVGDFSQPGGSGPANGEILFFPRTANGAPAPARDITGPATQLATYVQSLTLDAARNELYALAATQDQGNTTFRIVVFDALASGNVAPLRVIEGNAAQLEGAGKLFFDPATDRLWATSGYGLGSPKAIAFPRLANGNVAPTQVIAGNTTQMVSPLGIVVVDTDAVFKSSFETGE